MNSYHIYQAIGKGKYSNVYKGRKKKTLDYFAIKSVDKSQKNKVLHEVKILQSLDHPNVLKLYSWYETSTHLWLVLEYCVGGDLMALLRQDGEIPEESVHDISFDLVRALLFLHSNGSIYCDLKPSNILLDENGRAKLCDFELTRMLSDISASPSSLGKCGTPFYMAPELFQDRGVHSFASDLWSLGCVMYECYTGKPPFSGTELTELVKSILLDPPPPLPGSPTRPFANLVHSLLVKDPAERLQWPELCRHAFWRTSLTPLPLPPQPAFSSIVDQANRPARNRTPPDFRDKDPKGPAKGTPAGRRNQVRTGPSRAEKQRDVGSTGPRHGVDVLRLSKIAKSNLRREIEKENYRMPAAKSPENENEVKIENTDMELNFDENAAEEDPDTEERPAGEVGRTDVPTVSDTAESKCEDSERVGESPAVLESPVDGPEEDSALEFLEEPGSVSEVMWHPSDHSVRPVMPGRKAEKLVEGVSALPFEVPPAADIVRMPKEQLDVFTQNVVSALSGNGSAAEKQGLLRHLEGLCCNAGTANLLINGPVMAVLVKMLRQPKASVLRVHVVSLIGFLLRHSTSIDDTLATSGIMGALTDALRDRQDKVRRFSIAALGELLFYIATVSEHGRDNTPAESPSKDNRSPTTGWQVPSSLISLVCSILRKGEDETGQMYVLRTIENVCSQGGQWASRFTSKDVMVNLCHIFRAPGKPESMRLTAGSCLVRLVCFNASGITLLLDRLSARDVASALVKAGPREQQLCLNLLNMTLLSSQMFPAIARHVASLSEEKQLGPGLTSLVEQGGEALRGKALILVALLCKTGRRWTSHFFSAPRLLSAVDRLARERSPFVRHCLSAFLHLIVSLLPPLLDSVASDLQQIAGGRRFGQLAFHSARAASRINLRLLPVLHLLASSAFKSRVVNLRMFTQLADLVKKMESSFQGREEVQMTVLRVVERATEDVSLLGEWPAALTADIVPSLLLLYKGNPKDGDARFLSLKLVLDVTLAFLDRPPAPSSDEAAAALRSVAQARLLPLYPSMSLDGDPIPAYAHSLLLLLLDSSLLPLPPLLHPPLLPHLFRFLSADPSSATLDNLRLALALLSSPDLPPSALSALRLARPLARLLLFARSARPPHLLRPALALARALLLRSSSAPRPDLLLLDENAPLPPPLVDDVSDLCPSLGALLAPAEEDGALDVASECVVLLLAAAPREAAAGLLAHLSKVGPLLEAGGGPGSDGILRALAFSCRMFASRRMISSVSVVELTRLDEIISRRAAERAPGFSEAADIALSEIRRLRSCA